MEMTCKTLSQMVNLHLKWTGRHGPNIGGPGITGPVETSNPLQRHAAFKYHRPVFRMSVARLFHSDLFYSVAHLCAGFVVA